LGRGASLELVGGEEAAVGEASGALLEVEDAADFGGEFVADGGEQRAKSGIVGRLRRGRSGRARVSNGLEVGLEHRCVLLSRYMEGCYTWRGVLGRLVDFVLVAGLKDLEPPRTLLLPGDLLKRAGRGTSG